MKFHALLAALLLPFVSGCIATSPTYYYNRNFEIGQKLNATVGSLMIDWSYGTTMPGGVRDGMKMELIYCGRAKEGLLVKYREYNVNFQYTAAREPFYLDLKYDISPPSTLSFQDLVIRVDSADQNRISFAVVDGPHVEETYDNSGKVGLFIDAGGSILGVAANMPAQQAGLQIGDQIVKVDGKPVPVGNHDAILSMLTGKPNSVVEIQVNRGENVLVFRVSRKRH
jgi:membrane-associated protease RseP (regulator of RpoE activity)